MFYDRKDAGRQLAKKLLYYKDKNPVVLGIARGGLEIAKQIADTLEVDFEAVITRKLPFPQNPEAGFGAVAEDGGLYLHSRYRDIMRPEDIERIRDMQVAEIHRRAKVIRKSRPLPNLASRIVILADDGIAMGSTMKASIELCKARKCKKVVVAAPVSGAQVKVEMQSIADDVVILDTPRNFRV